MAGSLSDEKLTVKIDETTYSLVKVPSEDSAVVKQHEEQLLGAVDLKSLVEDLGRVGKFVRVAYNGVGAAGSKPEFVELQIKVQDLGYDITKLCDKSAVTVAKFKKASGTILVDLQSTYEYLLDNLEEMAVETLATVSKLAGTMADAAKELHEEFQEQGEKVKKTIEETMKSKAEQAELVKQKKQERLQIEMQQQKEKRLIEEARHLEEEAARSYRKYEEREDEAIIELSTASPGEGPSGVAALINGFTSFAGYGPVFGQKKAAMRTEDKRKAAEKAAERWKEKRCEALKNANEQREIRHAALQSFTDFAVKLVECQGEHNMAAIAVDALHEAMRGLKQLSAIMMKAALFWRQMQEHCQSLAESEMQKQVERALKLPDEKRLKVWTSNGFKTKAIHFYAGWVALHGVCTKYMEQIKLTQRDLYEYLQENPTYDQSRRLLPQLAKEFRADLKAAQKAIAAQSTAATEEIKSLSAK